MAARFRLVIGGPAAYINPWRVFFLIALSFL
jgi:hypothetical protein